MRTEGWVALAALGVAGLTGCKSGNAGTTGAGGGDAAPAIYDAGGADAATPALDCSQDDPDWPSFNHDVCNTRSPTTTGGLTTATASKLALKWTYSAAGEISANPAVVGGQVYVGDWAGMMTRLDATSGSVVWSTSVTQLAGLVLPDGGLPGDLLVARGTPIVTSDALVFGTARTGYGSLQPLAYLAAVDPTSGAPLWATLLDDNPAAVVTGSPVLEGTTIYVGVSSMEEAITSLDPEYACCTFRGSIVALDAMTGDITWKTPMIEDSVYFGADGTTPAGYAGAAIWSGVPTIDRKRQRLYVTTGNNYAMPSVVTTAPTADHVESIVALDMATGAIAWSRQMTTNDIWTFANQKGGDFDFGCGANLFQASVGGVTKDLVGAGQKSGIYWVLDAETGDVVWKTQVGPGGHLGGIQWGTAYDGSHVYFGVNDTDGTAYTLAGGGAQSGTSITAGSWGALDPASGSVLWQIANPAMTAPLGGASVNGPVTVVGGVMLAGSMDHDGTMYAFDATTGAVLWSFAAGATVYGGPAVAGGVVYWGAGYPSTRLGFGGSAKKLYAFAVP